MKFVAINSGIKSGGWVKVIAVGRGTLRKD